MLKLIKALSVVAAISLTLTQVVSAAEVTTEKKPVLSSYELPVKDTHGTIIGTQKTSLSILSEETNGDKKTTIVDITNYSMKDTSESSNKVFKNGTKTTVVERKQNGDYYINGTKLTATELSQQIAPQKLTTMFVESGGVSALTYYTNFSDNPDLYECWGYPQPTNNFLDGGAGTKLDRFVKPIYPYTISKLSDFKMYANSVASARSTINTSSVALAGALGVLALTWETVVGALVGGIGVASSAYAIYNASGDGKSAMSSAYNILQGWSTGVNN
ncbi:hypothetical protein [Paenibacillus ferrarius]|uniref:hypothetical protein n=1 Tax=Paenibacillus ferrarius TaxID=1469647 RepID=UPI003D2B8F23